MNLDGVARGPFRCHRGEPFREAGFARVPFSRVLEPSGPEPQQPRGLIVGLHLRDHFFHQLMLPDLDAERLALFGVGDARVAARANEPGRSGRHGEASLIEREHGDLEALVRPSDDVLFRHLHIVHLEEAGVTREDAPLLFHRPARKALEAALDDERRQAGRVALLFLLEIGPRDDEEVVRHVGQRDPALLAREHVPVALLDRGRLNRACIAARARFGQAVSGNFRPLRLRHEITAFLILGSPGQERQTIEARVDRHDHPQRRVDVLELFARDPEADVIHARAAVFLRHRNPKQAKLCHAAQDAIAVEMMPAIVLADVRRHLTRRPLAHRPLQQALFVCE